MLLTTAVLPLTLTAPTAHAALVDAICAGSVQANFNPGLTFEAQTVNVSTTARYPTCANLSGNGKQLAVATESFSGTGTADCLTGVVGGSGTINWASGDTSGFTYQVTVSGRPDGVLELLATGSITSGLFKGDKLTENITNIPNVRTQCLSENGMTNASGTDDLVISPVV
ncbi:hypothetical protein ABZ746_38690 [Streptomyces sp. NPDC020096]